MFVHIYIYMYIYTHIIHAYQVPLLNMSQELHCGVACVACSRRVPMRTSEWPSMELERRPDLFAVWRLTTKSGSRDRTNIFDDEIDHLILSDETTEGWTDGLR